MHGRRSAGAETERSVRGVDACSGCVQHTRLGCQRTRGITRGIEIHVWCRALPCFSRDVVSTLLSFDWLKNALLSLHLLCSILCGE